MRYRVGRHNPHTLYVRDKGVVMREPGERPIGFISDEAMAMLAAEAMTAAACPACPLACVSCSRNRATCECYEHQDRIDEDGQPVEGSTPLDSPLLVRCRSNPEPHEVDDDCQDIYEAPAAPAGEVADRCPACGSPEPGLHPNTPSAQYDDGPALRCLDPFHGRAGEVVSVPPPESLDEILILVEEVALARVKAHVAANRDDGPRAAQHGDRAKAFRLAIAVAVEGVRAAGAEEGRRLAAEAIREDRSFLEGLYDQGIAEGRRQATGPVLAEVVAERIRQDARWGEQNHPDGTNLDNAGWRDNSRDLTEVAAKQGRVTWAHILQEEFVEALAEVEPARIRAELIQTAAVAVAWIQAIDRRSA